MITTSRYCSINTRKKAKQHAAESGTIFITRAKRSISDLVVLARKLGEEEIIIIEEDDHLLATTAKIRILENGEWCWV